MNRKEKESFISSLRHSLEDASLVVVVQPKGLTMTETTDLRRRIREVNAQIKVTKNTLTRISLEGTAFAGLSEHLNGPTALAFSKDPVAAAKAVVEYANTNEKLSVIAGGMNGKILSAKEVEVLAKLPSLDVLRAQLIGIITTPATRIAGVVQAPAAQLARVCSAYAQKG